MITAEQARQRAKAAISNYEYSQFNEIMENIDKRSAQGYYNYYGDGALRPTVRKNWKNWAMILLQAINTVNQNIVLVGNKGGGIN